MPSSLSANLIKALFGQKPSIYKGVKIIHILFEMISKAFEDGVIDSLITALRQDDVDVILK